MKNRITTLTVTAAILILVMAIAWGGSADKIDLKSLEGDWEGEGEFLVPVTGMNMSLEGTARFDYDTTTDRLRTSLVGKKYFFSYSDSGYLDLNEETDSISWEVWDNFGKHALYHGLVSGNRVTGERFKKGNRYEVMIELVTPDSIDFRLSITEPDGNQFDRATFHLWRVKD